MKYSFVLTAKIEIQRY